VIVVESGGEQALAVGGVAVLDEADQPRPERAVGGPGDQLVGERAAGGWIDRHDVDRYLRCAFEHLGGQQLDLHRAAAQLRDHGLGVRGRDDRDDRDAKGLERRQTLVGRHGVHARR
jgi:hypothetical protein